MFTSSLQSTLRTFTRNQDLLKVMDYAVLPAGKLFRPRLVEALAKDLQGKLDENKMHLALAVEFHHAYTLVHDDLPSMDNDLIRRGKPSTHAAFGEWQAVLAGDALLIASFQELAKIKHERAWDVHRLFTWCTGAKGLIQGQFEDLGSQGKASLPQIVRIHELKTARLIQVCTLGTELLSSPTPRKKEFLRLGREIGVSFQLLDDLGELTSAEVSEHEKEINPFLLEYSGALIELQRSHARLKKLLKQFNLSHLSAMLEDYFKKNQSDLLAHEQILAQNLSENDLTPLKSWLTSFV